MRNILWLLLLFVAACSSAGPSRGLDVGVARAADGPAPVPPPIPPMSYWGGPDCILINGQSNAVAWQHVEDNAASADGDEDPWILTFGTHNQSAAWPTDASGNLPASWNPWYWTWGTALGDEGLSSAGAGQFALHMARELKEQLHKPIFPLNHSWGGQPISVFARNDLAHFDLTTNYGQMLYRSYGMGVPCKALVWWQGEYDGATVPPSSGITPQAYHDAFAALRTAWMQDYTALQRIYVVQVRPGCGGPTTGLLDVQRRFQQEWANVSVLPSLALPGHDGCHYNRDGYWAIGEALAILIERDVYGGASFPGIDAPDVASAAWACGCADHTQVVLTMRDASAQMRVTGDNTPYFTAGTMQAVSVAASGNQVFVTFPASAAGLTLSYSGHAGDGPQVVNQRDLGLLAFQLPAPL